MRMDVRDYELDQFGVVNNAIFASYVQHARHEAFSALGYSMAEITADGTALALSNLNLTFLAPLRSRDTFEASVWIDKVTAARLVMGQEITLVASQTDGNDVRKPGQRVLVAEAVVVFLDAKYTPVRIPATLKGAFAELAAQHQQASAPTPTPNA